MTTSAAVKTMATGQLPNRVGRFIGLLREQPLEGIFTSVVMNI